MQFLHRLIRTTNEKGIDHQDSTSSSSTSTTNHKGNKVHEVNRPIKRLIVLKRDYGGANQRANSSGTKGSKASCKKYLKLFLLCRKEASRACFHGTINLKSPRTSDIIDARSRKSYLINNSMKMKKEEVVIGKVDPGSNKVLPISEATTTLLASKNSSNDQTCTNNGGALEKKEKAKTMSRMKELLRWAAAAKSEKGGKFIGRKVLQFRNRGNQKTISDDNQFSIESPKISFRWDVESCSTTSSVYSANISVTSLKNNPNLSMLSLNSATNNNSPARKGNWITTDSEFVVLEL